MNTFIEYFINIKTNNECDDVASGYHTIFVQRSYASDVPNIR